MLVVWLDDRENLHFLLRAAEDLARAEAPETVTRAFTMSTMTALQKKDGGVRGIAMGTFFVCLSVAHSLANSARKWRQCALNFSSPFRASDTHTEREREERERDFNVSRWVR